VTRGPVGLKFLPANDERSPDGLIFLERSPAGLIFLERSPDGLIFLERSPAGLIFLERSPAGLIFLERSPARVQRVCWPRFLRADDQRALTVQLKCTYIWTLK
jgi:hypothetical protein